MNEKRYTFAALGLMAAVCLMLCTAWGVAAYLEQDFQKDQPAPPPPRPEPPPIRPPRPIPPPGNEVTRLVDQALIGQPYQYRGLTVFPVELRHEPDGYDYATLDDAFRRRLIEVYETGEVSRLSVQNLSREYVFGMAGEVLAGGKQNRLLREDVLLPPQSERVIVPVYCGERGRWSDRPAEGFGHTGRIVPQRLRAAAQAQRPQADIWEAIRDKAAEAGVRSDTEDFAAIPADAKVARELGEYSRVIDRIWLPRHCGVVVADHGRLVGADLFCNATLFAKLRGKLIEGYALDVIGRPMPKIALPPYGPTRDDALRYLQAVYSARTSYEASPGTGQAIAIWGAATGRALALRGSAIHLSLYQALYGPPIVPMPREER